MHLRIDLESAIDLNYIKMIIIQFPIDFQYRSEYDGPYIKHIWVYPKKLQKDNEAKPFAWTVSIIGGNNCYGDGVTTYEMWDIRKREPVGYLSEANINLYLSENPL